MYLTLVDKIVQGGLTIDYPMQELRLHQRLLVH